MDKAINKLQKLTGKKHIFFTDRGNTSIKLCTKLSKNIGKTKVFIQDQGGWMTYPDFIQKENLELHYLDSDYGILTLSTIKKHIDKESVLLINSMPGYFAMQKDMDKIEKLCSEKGCLLINDVAGSIGSVNAKFGDIIFGSFGRWKPVNNEYGGFIATDIPEYLKFFKENKTFDLKEFYPDLNKKLDDLDKRLKFLHKKVKTVKKQLKDFDIIHRDSDGLNVIVKFFGPEEKLKILDFCKIYGYEFTLCPRYIRVLDDAISIELKRLEQ